MTSPPQLLPPPPQVEAKRARDEAAAEREWARARAKEREREEAHERKRRRRADREERREIAPVVKRLLTERYRCGAISKERFKEVARAVTEAAAARYSEPDGDGAGAGLDAELEGLIERQLRQVG